jgi:hypothetical protein
VLSSVTSPKIRADHLDRQALIYVRQSTFMQVRRNTGSTARQYDLRQRAVELGWSVEQIVIIDQDQGRSGASSANREGFQFLVAEVGLGHAGAVFSLEASRLARASSDWYRLIEICALTNTLVVDEEGVYDPGQYNDRLLLGFYIIYNLGRVRCHLLSLPSGEPSLQVIVCRQLVQMIHQSKIILNQPLDLLHQDELTPILYNRCLHHSQRWQKRCLRDLLLSH